MKFNSAQRPEMTENLAGGQAYKQNDKLHFLALLLTSFVEDKFYSSTDEQIKTLRKLLKKIDPLFAAKALIYARTEFGMRSITHAGAVELLPYIRGTRSAKHFFDRIVYRPDDMTEMVAYYLASVKELSGEGKVTLPNSMKKGFALAFNRFDAYKLGKYRMENARVKLVDVVNLVHPTPTEENAEALNALVSDTLRATDTWERGLSEAGKTDDPEAKSKVWYDLLKQNKLGYFALLRNLRNIIDQAPKLVPLALEQLVNEEVIKKSLVLPFRFKTAYNQIKNMEGHSTQVRNTLASLSDAVELSLNNVPKFEGKTLVAIDCSGSMMGSGEKSPIDIASLFGGAIAKTNNCDIILFDDHATLVQFNPKTPLLELFEQIRSKARSGGTDFNCIFRGATEKYDRIIILSDMQAWVDYYTPKEELKAYKARTGANPKIYSFDLNGYGSIQFPAVNIYQLTGFSEKVFTLMKMFEEDKDIMLSAVENIQL